MKPTKEKLLFDTFKLFAQSTYEGVTFDEIEKATGLTRGAISYHFHTKENLFIAVIEEYVFKNNSIRQIQISKSEKFILKGFIKDFINHCFTETERVNKLGIPNFNLSYFNLEHQCLFFYPDFKKKALLWLNGEKKVWEDIIITAIQNNEIKHNINAKRFASIFTKLYLGDSYIGVFHKNGQDLKMLEKDFMHIYKSIKI